MTDPRSSMTRRGLLVFGAGALVAAATPLTTRTRRRIYRRSLPVMGTIAELTVVADRPGAAEGAMDAAADELQRIERLMSRYSRTSDVGRVNFAPPHVPIRIDAETATVVLAALRWAEASQGAFDPAIERVVALWDVQERTSPPPQPSVQRLAARHLYRALELSTHGGASTIMRRDADVGLDLGGIAKGYAVDCAADALRAHGIASGIVNVGGDLVAIGEAPEGAAWRVGVRSPFDATALIGEVDVRDCAVATSGDYERFFEYHGVRYHHLMDPETAAPRMTPVHSLTTRASTCMHADAAGTACYGMDAVHARATLRAARASAEIILQGGQPV